MIGISQEDAQFCYINKGINQPLQTTVCLKSDFGKSLHVFRKNETLIVRIDDQ